jgi:uncharacterized protein
MNSRSAVAAWMRIAVVFVFAPLAAGQVSLTTLGVPHTQNFDTLPTTVTTPAATWTNNSTIPGWFHARTGTGTTIVPNNGSNGAGNLYSYGTGTAAERALGSVGSGNAAVGNLFWGIRLQNNTGSTITQLDVTYVGEQWRQGGCSGVGCVPQAQTVSFSYLIGSPTVTGSLAEFQSAGTAVASLHFTSPSPGATSAAAALDGNAAANRTAKSFSITGLNIPNGTEVMLRWSDPDHANNDHGLSIDDFSVTPQGAAPLPNLTVTDVSQVETNGGTTTFTFQVNLSAPAGPGGVTFDIATADGTAQDDNPAVSEDNDYVAQSLTPPAATIAAGNSTFPFNVTVNGDLAPESNETFFVNVTNVTGATVTDGQGQGTIQNDDAACGDLSISDVTQAETNGGTTTFAFTVSLSQAGCGTVTFDIATADGTAQDDNPATEDFDYVPQALTGQTITFPATYPFNVTVNGDVSPEANQTFFVNITNVSPASVQVLDGQGLGTIVNDDFTRIHDIQGPLAASPISGATVTLEGIVTGDFQPVANDNRLSGFFVQEEDSDADADPMTSEGIFVFCSACPTNVAEGQKVQVTGTVSEFFNLTEISATTAGSVVISNAGNNLAQVTATTIDLPVVGVIDDFYEPRESMLVTFLDTLTVADSFEQTRYGRIELFEGGRPRQFTEANPPSVPGLAAHVDGLNRRRVYLDDDDNAENSVLNLPDGSEFVFHPRANGGLSIGTQGTDFFRGGDLVSGLTGILDYSFSGGSSPNEWRVRPVTASPATFTVANPRPATAPAVGGAIKAASVNVLNYFTTLNQRGADSTAELNRQRERTSIVLCGLDADVAALMEIENHPTNVTITDLLTDVNLRCGGTQPYAFVNTGGALGTDEIRVMLIYRTGVVSPVGAPLVDSDAVHNRPPTAQTFDVVDALNPAFGQRFTALANHSKSKGSCPGSGPDADQNDGQGCFSVTRVAQANRLLTWVNGTVIPAAGDPDVLMLGDFNAYAQETATATLVGGGYTDLETAFLGSAAYSYLFDGQLGHLDYAFSSASLTPQVTGISPWHINADENPLFDYNDEIDDGAAEQAFEEKPDGSALVPPRVLFQPASPFRASDHDPILLGIFQVADVSITKILNTAGPYFEGQSISYTLTVANSGPGPASSIQVTDTPTNLTINAVSGACTSFSPCTIASLGAGSNAVITVTATINAPGAFDNSADATAAEIDPNIANNTDNTGNGGTAGASADVSISKTLDTAVPFSVGQSVTYTIVVTNGGPSAATNINVTDTPTNLTITNVSGACTSFAPCTIASLASGASTNITVTATINSAGAFDNSATATATENDFDTADNTDNTGNGGTAAASADVSLTKTLDTAPPYTIGQAVTYTITVTNAGPSTATNITVTDTPTNLTITNVSGACTTFSPCTIASLASGANTTITVTATVDSSGPFQNSATAIPTEADPDSADRSAADGDVASQVADVTATKSVSGSFVQGTNVIYTIVLTNNMTVTQPNDFQHEFVDVLPAGLTYVSSTASSGTAALVLAPDTFAWNGSIPPGGTVTITITCTISPTASGTISNQGHTNFDTNGDGFNDDSHLSDDPSTAAVDDPTSFVVLQSGIVDATKSVSGTYVQGTNITYTIVLTNNMTVTQPNNAGSEFTDPLSAQLTPVTVSATSGTAVFNGNTIDWDGSIPAGGTVTITAVATISSTATGLICNQGQSVFDKDGDNVNESSEFTDDPATAGANDATCFVVVQSGIVDGSKSVSGAFVQGTNVTYTVVLTNNMTVAQNDNAGNEFTDTLPAQLTLVSANATSGTTATGSGNLVTWNGSIPTGGTVTITIVATINPSATGTVSNQGTSFFDADGNNANESSEPSDDPSTAADDDPTSFVVVQSGSVDVTKSVSGTFVQGSNVTYTVVLTNNMTVAQNDNAGNEFTDTLPAQLTLVSANATSGTTATSGGNLVTWNGSIPAGGTVTITIVASINATATGSVSNQGTSFFDADGNNANESSEPSDDPSTATDDDPTSFMVIPAGVVTATKSANTTSLQGSAVAYTIVVTNDMGIAQANNAGDELTDVLPASLALVSATATSGVAQATVGTNTVTWNGALAAGASATITINATIDADATGAVSNQATLAFDADGNGTNEGAGVSDDPGTATANDPTTFTVILTDSDGDGVDDVIEQAAPNGGDGNGDGISDHTQATVASLPAATGSGYLTLQSSCSLREVYVTTESAMPSDDHGFEYPHGMIAFRAPCTSATFSLFVYGSGAVSSYRKYGPLPPGGPSQWYQLPGASFQVVTVGSLHPRRIDFALRDGGTGDDTPVDGVIVDQGGPAEPTATIPTLDQWALLALAMAMAAFAALKLRT